MDRALSRLSVFSWALYDLANTIFSMNIVSLYYSLYVVNVMGGTDATYGDANSLSMLLMFLTAPLLGAISDQFGRRKPFLVASTLVCVTLTFFLGTSALTLSLALFVFANYAFQAGLIFYDSLLADVSTEENRGRVGGLGIGLGYLGSFIGVGSGLLLLDRIGYPGMFRLTAVLFLVFAVPCFLFVKEQPKPKSRSGRRKVVGAFRQVFATLRHVRQYRDLPRFLVGRLFYADAVNTVIVFMGIYVTNEVGFTETQAQVVLLVAVAAAVVGGFLWGIVVDRTSPKRSLDAVLLLWMVDLLAAAAIAYLHLPSWLFWIVACLAGIALGGTWAADRPLMLRLAPPEYLGEFYGLYSMVGRFANITGPFLWGVIVDRLGWGRPAAILYLLGFVLLSYLVLRPVDDSPRDPSRNRDPLQPLSHSLSPPDGQNSP